VITLEDIKPGGACAGSIPRAWLESGSISAVYSHQVFMQIAGDTVSQTTAWASSAKSL
jgi:hypothetical protein